MEYARIENGEVVTIGHYPDTWDPHAPGLLAKGYDFRPVHRNVAFIDPITEASIGDTVTVQPDRVVIDHVIGPRTISADIRLHAEAIAGLFAALGIDPLPVTFAEAEAALAAYPDQNAAIVATLKILAERIALTEDGGTWDDVRLVASEVAP